MSAENISPAFADFDQASEIDLGEVLALQSLAMGDVRRAAIQGGRRIRVTENPRTRSYCVLRNSGWDIQNGETDQILSVRVRKLGHYSRRAWTMAVSFLEYEQSAAGYLDNNRTVYQFRWDNVMAKGRKQEIPTIGRVKTYDVQPGGMPVFPTTESVRRTIVTPLDTAEMDVVANRMLDVVYTAAPRVHHLIDRVVAERVDSVA